MKTLEERQLKISGSVNFFEEINIENEVGIIGNLQVYSVEKKNNEDGTYNMIYKAKFPEGVELIDSGRKLRTKDKSKKSQQLRRKIAGIDSSEEYYQKTLDKLIHNIEDVVRYLDESFY